MNRLSWRTVLIMGFVTVVSPYLGAVTISSPDGKIQASVDSVEGDLQLNLSKSGGAILEPSALGIKIDGAKYGKDVTSIADKKRKTLSIAGSCPSRCTPQRRPTISNWGLETTVRS